MFFVGFFQARALHRFLIRSLQIILPTSGSVRSGWLQLRSFSTTHQSTTKLWVKKKLKTFIWVKAKQHLNKTYRKCRKRIFLHNSFQNRIRQVNKNRIVFFLSASNPIADLRRVFGHGQVQPGERGGAADLLLRMRKLGSSVMQVFSLKCFALFIYFYC